jgi:acyl-CoA thioesterase
VKPGYSKAVMPLETPQKNGVGIAHGGAIFGLADVAFGSACNSSGELALGIVSSINYLSAGTTGPLTAEARELHRSHKLGHYEVLVFDGNGALMAACRATAYFLGELLPGMPGG